MEHHYITINGETKTLAEWCHERGIDPQRYYQRKKHGETDEAALRPVAPRKKNKPSIRDLAKKSGITLQTYYRRRQRGLSKEEALTMKPHTRTVGRSQVEESLAEKCRRYGITTTTYYKRIHLGMTPEEALTTKKYIRYKKT